jgi:hypothetical protein
MPDLQYIVDLNAQPTETTCGPTCLHGLYQYHGSNAGHHTLIDEVKSTIGGGTLGVHLGLDAIKRGFDVTIYTHNLNVFDPSWFDIEKPNLIAKLLAQAKAKPDTKAAEASQHYADLLRSGGKVLFEELTPQFLFQVLLRHGPLICGLSATYLYMSKREINETCTEDDVKGYPQGHFVLLSGMSEDLKQVEVTDPLEQNPIHYERRYRIPTQHFINSVLIGVITYDANFLAIKKKDE